MKEEESERRLEVTFNHCEIHTVRHEIVALKEFIQGHAKRPRKCLKIEFEKSGYAIQCRILEDRQGYLSSRRLYLWSKRHKKARMVA